MAVDLRSEFAALAGLAIAPAIRGIHHQQLAVCHRSQRRPVVQKVIGVIQKDGRGPNLAVKRNQVLRPRPFRSNSTRWDEGVRKASQIRPEPSMARRGRVFCASLGIALSDAPSGGRCRAMPGSGSKDSESA